MCVQQSRGVEVGWIGPQVAGLPHASFASAVLMVDSQGCIALQSQGSKDSHFKVVGPKDHLI